MEEKSYAEEKDYLEIIKERGRQSRVYKKYQFIGLEIARLLNDENHKSLYIKLAKEYGSEKMFVLAKDVSERKKVKNKGAYFMKVIQKTILIKSEKENDKSNFKKLKNFNGRK